MVPPKMQDDSEFNSIHFVKLVENQPCLYDITNDDYYRAHLQEQAWSDIAQSIGRGATIKDCKARWRNLRGRFTKHLKNHTSNDPNERTRKPYYLAEFMEFLLPFLKTKRPLPEGDNDCMDDDISQYLEVNSVLAENENHDNIEIEYKPIIEQGENSESDIAPEIVPMKRRASTKPNSAESHPKYKRYCEPAVLPPKSNTFQQPTTSAGINYEDSDVLFLMSLLPDLKRMNEYQKRKYKIGLLTLGGEILNDDPNGPPATCESAVAYSLPRIVNSSSSHMSPDSRTIGAIGVGSSLQNNHRENSQTESEPSNNVPLKN